MADQSRSLLGVGIYTRAEAGRLLNLSPARVSSWLRGYRYSWGPRDARRRGTQPPVLKTDIPLFGGTLVVSFLELMELRVVKRFRDSGTSLQAVRLVWERAAAAFGTDHPFAHHRFFAEAGHILVSLENEPPEAIPEVLYEISSRREPHQAIAGLLVKESIQVVEFDTQTKLVREWRPGGPTTPVVLNPRIAFGAPTVAGTRVPTDVLHRFARSRPIGSVAELFELTEEQVTAALDFETHLAKAA